MKLFTNQKYFVRFALDIACEWKCDEKFCVCWIKLNVNNDKSNDTQKPLAINWIQLLTHISPCTVVYIPTDSHKQWWTFAKPFHFVCVCVCVWKSVHFNLDENKMCVLRVELCSV